MIIVLMALSAGIGSNLPLRHSADNHATFSASTEDTPNPERGYYVPGKDNLEKLDTVFFSKAYAQGFRLAYTRIDLAPYRSRELPASFLRQLSGALQAARSSGMKVIVRAVYNYPAGETDYRDARDAPLLNVLDHIRQLKPLLQDNVDVIAFVQAGFIGAWGEWHTSSNNLTEPSARLKIRDALLGAVPPERFIQFRYPPYLMAWTPQLPTLTATLNGAFRTGFHNDCFLASSTDVGTYSEDPSTRETEREYADRLGDLAPFGGETCNPADSPGAKPRSTCTDINREGARFNLTYLNSSYYRPWFHDRWLSQGCAANVARNMGYRFRLVDAFHVAAAKAGATVAWHITLANDGWARLYNPRPLQILLRNRSNGKVERLDAFGTDPRGWLPSHSSKIKVSTKLPQAVHPGHYDVLLALPDAAPRLRGDPRYAIRFANADVVERQQRWDPVLGAYSTGTMIKVN
jgi:hypothetical protein